MNEFVRIRQDVLENVSLFELRENRVNLWGGFAGKEMSEFVRIKEDLSKNVTLFELGER